VNKTCQKANSHRAFSLHVRAPGGGSACPEMCPCRHAARSWPPETASTRARAIASCCSSNDIEGDGPTIFAHACKMGLEGIVSKRKDSPYRSGRSPDWLKMKNAVAPAVRREAKEHWAR
jgi:hypothetical protein